jgi:putative membrane protein
MSDESSLAEAGERADGSGGTAGTGAAPQLRAERTDTPREYLTIYLKGAAMGTADAVPGVSGGTIALIAGIYERLIAAITDFDVGLLRAALSVHTAAGSAAFAARLRALDLGFLLALGLGVGTALVTVSRVIEVALVEYTALTFAFFFGLIAASAAVLCGEVAVDTPRRIAVAVAGFVFATVLTGEVTAVLPNTPLVVFLAGVVAISAMILPGISGSFLLLILGQYEYVVRSLRQLTDAVLAADVPALLADGSVLVSFATGAGVGLLTTSRVIEWALANYRAATLTFLVSLMVGALRLPVVRVIGATPEFTLATTAPLVLTALVGTGAVLALDHFTDDIL